MAHKDFIDDSDFERDLAEISFEGNSTDDPDYCVSKKDLEAEGQQKKVRS